MLALLAEYPLWLFILCAFVGAAYSLFLYYKNSNIEYEVIPNRIMSVLRGLSVTLITFLLLAPMFKMVVKQMDKPIILFAVDNSESIIATGDSAYYSKEYLPQLQQLISSFDDKYEVKTYLIGENDRLFDPDKVSQNVKFDDKSSNLSSLFEQISTVFVNRNIGAMVLLSDGIFNVGANPFYQSEKVNFPIYTVGLGNTELPVDLAIVDVLHNRQTFKGNFFPVEIKVAATKLAGKKFTLTLLEKDNVLFTRDLTISGTQYFETVKLSLEAKSNGVHQYRVLLSEIDGELTTKNNSTTFFIEVVDSREKIAIVYNSPHPDVSAIKAALEVTDKYQVELFPISDFKNQPDQYSLIILHQLPSFTNSAGNLLSSLQKSSTSVLIIIGDQTNLSVLNSLNFGLSIFQTKKSLTNNAMPLYNDNFTSFTFSEEAKTILKNYPPLITPFGEYKTAVSSNTFFYQKINGVSTGYPLIMFNDLNNMKVGFITGEGLWQWRMYNYLYAQNHDAFDEIINKLALYLSAKGDKSFFRVYTQNVFDENSSVEFSAELYNDSYELISDPDVSMVVKSSDGKQYNAQFSKQNNAYYLNMGELPIDDYTWQASVSNGNKNYSKTGKFTVREVMIESVNLVADHALLQSMANSSNAKFYLPADMNQISMQIKNNDNIKPIASYNKKYNLLLNSPWYFVILVLLLGVEWFMRKWGGGY